MVIRFFDSWRQSICPLRFQSPTVKDTKKRARKWHEGTKHLIRQLREQCYRTMTIGIATLVPQTNLPETPSYTEAKLHILKAKSEGCQEDHMGWFQKERLLFLPGNLQWKLVNSLHATAHLGEGPPKITRKVLQRNRPPNNYMASGLLLSHLPIKQPPRSSKTPAGPAHPTTWDLPRRGLADGLHPDASFSRG